MLQLIDNINVNNKIGYNLLILKLKKTFFLFFHFVRPLLIKNNLFFLFI